MKHIDGEKDRQSAMLFDLLRIPGISTDPDRAADIRRSADWLKKVFDDAGIKCERVETARHPCLLADTGNAGSGPTILIYGHYDVQPVGDESLWKSPAFEPTVRDGAIFARGSADDKGPMLALVLAVANWKKVAGKTPIRIKFCIEGEEEIGSPNLGGVIRKHADRLACDYVVLSDTPKFDSTIPAITYGTKGLVYMEMTVTGPKQNLHSGSYGGTVVNPGNVVAAIIASLKDAKNRVTIPHFYDDVVDLTPLERKQIKELPFDEAAYRDGLGVPALDGEQGYTTLERKWARPTLDVNGMIGGYTGAGASTVIPAKVTAKVSMRIVPNQKADRIAAAFEKAVRAATPAGVRIDVSLLNSCPPFIATLESPGIQAAADALEAGFGKRPVFMREGGSLPILPLFKEVLGADSLMIGFCQPDCNAHGPNEFFHLDDFHRGIRTAAHLLDRLAR